MSDAAAGAGPEDTAAEAADVAAGGGWVRVVAPLLCLAGIGAAGYLTLAHYSAKIILACPESGLVNCAKVTQSPQSVILGVPVAVLGLVYFVAIAPLHLPAAWRNPSPVLRRIRVAAAVAGIAMVLYLIYTELFTLDALCLWCTAVHVITFLLFVVTLVGTMQTAPAPALEG